MKRSGWLKRGKEWLARKVPMKRKNEKRAKERHAEAFGPPSFIDFVHNRGCAVARQSGTNEGCLGSIEMAHVVSRGAGGGWKNNVVALCNSHHREQHTVGIKTFSERHDLDLDLEACALTRSWEKAEYGW